MRLAASNAEIEEAFNLLQSELDESIQSRLEDTKKLFGFDNFDEDVSREKVENAP